MGDFHGAKLLAPYFLAYEGAVPVVGDPQPLNPIVAHEFAEWTLSGNAFLGGEIELVVTAGFGVDKLAIG